jgi:two-component system LytT family response regulator
MAEPPRRYRVVLVDDEPLARRTLRRLLDDDPEVSVVAECSDGPSALAAVEQHRPDLLFLDVQMPGMDGFEVLDKLTASRVDDTLPTPVVIFTTAHEDYALRAFDVAAADYLLKPFDDGRFGQALARAKKRAGSGAAGATGRTRTHLTLSQTGAVDVVDLDHLLWAEAADQYVRLHTASGTHLLRESMTQLEGSLDERRFLRVHRSCLVALLHVNRIESTRGGTGRVLLDDGTWLPVSRSRMPTLRARIRGR